ncbi:hypothetical protein [Methylobacterium sp. WL120]|uniref:hypothetical protein n=1 Tax=Methylobacterium sp. WL120 TaxID=2603887 RepID=UPI0011CC597F|nr:hypothetical protein [Methylobacterium sp. WL120]TXM68172.1 hypothetical protein FV229_08325 [Methylobacterium sp. WL120]
MMRSPMHHGIPGPSLDEIEAAIMKHFASYGIDRFPALFRGPEESPTPTAILGFTRTTHVFGSAKQDELLLVFDYQSTRMHGPHLSHVAFETPHPL